MRNNASDNIHLEFRDFEYVTKIAECRSVSSAADQLYITQPALSMYIKNLENRLGLPLFTRIGKKLIPTFFGNYMIEKGKSLLLFRNDIQHRLSDIKNQECGLIRVGITPARGITFLPAILCTFRRKYPNIEIRCLEDEAVILREKLLDGSLDIALYTFIAEHPKLTCQTLTSGSILLYVSRSVAENLPLEARPDFPHPWIDLRLLESFPFIRSYIEQNMEKVTLQIFKDFGISPKTAIRIRNYSTAVTLATYGYGVFLAPEYFLQNLKNTPSVLSFGDIPGQYTLPFVAATVKGVHSSILIKDFIKICRGVCSTQHFDDFLI